MIADTSPFLCAGCGHEESEHNETRCRGERDRRPCTCSGLSVPMLPEPHENVDAHVITSWCCRACGERQEVHGERAVGSWMECNSCYVESYLNMA